MAKVDGKFGAGGARVDRCVADDDDLAVALDGDGQRFFLPQAAAHVGRDLAVDAEAAVDAAVGVEAREDEVGERAADHDDLAVGLQRHAGAVAAEALERGLAGDAEAGVDAGRQRSVGGGGLSSSTIVSTAVVCGPSVAQPPGCDSVRFTVLFDSTIWSATIGTTTTRGVASPSAKNTLTLTAV